jgi:hypothetical protein
MIFVARRRTIRRYAQTPVDGLDEDNVSVKIID